MRRASTHLVLELSTNNFRSLGLSLKSHDSSACQWRKLRFPRLFRPLRSIRTRVRHDSAPLRPCTPCLTPALGNALYCSFSLLHVPLSSFHNLPHLFPSLWLVTYLITMDVNAGSSESRNGGTSQSFSTVNAVFDDEIIDWTSFLNEEIFNQDLLNDSPIPDLDDSGAFSEGIGCASKVSPFHPGVMHAAFARENYLSNSGESTTFERRAGPISKIKRNKDWQLSRWLSIPLPATNPIRRDALHARSHA